MPPPVLARSHRPVTLPLGVWCSGWMTPISAFVPAFLTTGSFALQVVHILKTWETKAISPRHVSAFGCGVLLWLVYGLKIGDRPVTIAKQHHAGAGQHCAAARCATSRVPEVPMEKNGLIWSRPPSGM